MGIQQHRLIRTTAILRTGVLCFVSVAAMISSGCDGSNRLSEQEKANEALADTLVEYTVRGRVTQLPGGPEHPAREFMVRHEAIPEFRQSLTPGDERLGMMSMAMAFPLGEGVSVEGLSVGDPIEMMFEAVYNGENGRLKGYAVHRLTLLDPGTTLDIAESTPKLP